MQRRQHRAETISDVWQLANQEDTGWATKHRLVCEVFAEGGLHDATL